MKEKKRPLSLKLLSLSHIFHLKILKTIFTLNAVTSFLKKNSVKSNTAGFIDSVAVSTGQTIKAGQILFTIRTKEANALRNSKRAKDTLSFTGIFRIKSSKDGIISKIEHQKGDYVLEGDELALVSDPNSLVFLLEVPFELRKYISVNSGCDIILPDKQVLIGIISSEMPAMDMNSQTVDYIVRTNSELILPENLIAKINIIKNISRHSATLPKAAVLTNETQTEYWIMKLINDSTAVKVIIQKGIETSDKVEILSPKLKDDDRILLTGNYGLPDTAKIKITNK